MQVAERHGIYVGIEPHQSISKTTEGLLRIATLVRVALAEGQLRHRERVSRR